MPELPDVESFKNYFERTSLNKKIFDIECESKELIKKISFKEFKKKLINKKFKTSWRRGKFLIVEIMEIPEKLVLHFGMTGDLNYTKQGTEKEGKDRFTRLTFKFSNRYELRWLNMRKLGKVYLVDDLNKIKLLKEMGPEPLSLSKNKFFDLLDKHKNKNIKAFLMDQRDIAGIGNVYSDEILFQSGIDPRRKIESLEIAEKEKLYKETIEVLKEAIKILSQNRNFGNFWLIPHRGTDMKCPNSKNKLRKETVAGRSAVFCSECQG